jgi:hypothetical protein
MLALGALTVSMAPVASAHADNLNPIIGGGIGAVAGAVIGQSIGGQNGAVIGAAVGGAAGVTIANEGSRQRNVQQPVYTRNPPVYVQPVRVQPVQVQPVYVQQQPVYVVAQPYYGYRPEHREHFNHGPYGHERYITEVRYETRDGWRGGERRGWGEQRFEGRGGDRHHD